MQRFGIDFASPIAALPKRRPLSDSATWRSSSSVKPKFLWLPDVERTS